jgi:hypothetical protein
VWGHSRGTNLGLPLRLLLNLTLNVHILLSIKVLKIFPTIILRTIAYTPTKNCLANYILSFQTFYDYKVIHKVNLSLCLTFTPWKYIGRVGDIIMGTLNFWIRWKYVTIFTIPADKLAAWYKAWNVFARSNAGIVGLNPTQGMDVYLCLFCVYVREWPCNRLIPRPRSLTILD